MLRVGLNPYGLTYVLGLQGRGSPRANPAGRGLEGFIAIGEELGVEVLEIFDPWIEDMSDDGIVALKDRLDGLGITSVISGSHITNAGDNVFRSARLLGADTIRFALTNVLCGARAEREDWDDLRALVARRVKELGARAADQGIMIAIENHQDFTSSELVEFCESAPGVGITFDMGNAFPVAEAPLDFTRRVAPHVRHIHLKDYRVQFTDQGFRLVRCAIGDGAVPFAEMIAMIMEHHGDMTAVMEPGALEARHVRLYEPKWWNGYPPKTAAELAACFKALRRNRLADDADFRTPWEREEDDALEAYEMDMIRRSAANMRDLGIMREEV